MWLYDIIDSYQGQNVYLCNDSSFSNRPWTIKANFEMLPEYAVILDIKSDYFLRIHIL